MARNDLIVGLDVGTTKICTVVGEASETGVDIIGIGTAPSTGLRRGVVVNIEKTVQCIKKSLEDAELMAGCDIRTVYAGIAGSHIQGFNSHGVIAVKGGEVTQRDVDRVIEAAKAIAIPMDREVLHTLPQEFIVDDQRGIADPLGMAGVRLEVKVHIVTGAVTSAQNIIRSCNRSGLDVSNIVLESLASSKAVLSPEEREIGVALVDIGGGTTDIAVFSKDSIKHTSVLALGGHNLTNDIAYGLRTPMMSAEKIKMDFGCAMADLVTQEEIIEVPSVGGRESRKMSKRVLSEICEPRCEEILALVDQELIKSGFKNMIAAGVVLTGGTVMIEGMQELAEQIFDLPVRIGIPGEGIGGLTAEVRSPKYATAVGLLLHGAEEEGLHKVRPFKIRDDSGFDRIVSRMKKWFTDIA
ncbi:cell division protein FtsA [Pseudodesulfovibrio nedwellii]|uniref:Cell division protein FtsA n=1 Tax=Pseudodesulfovibrio nedwellii TaxID=2973072 RepID=A0ABN6S5T5_9BACT|nr:MULTISPECIES: cell division protein FtsA [Pseudodesulfovibrio]BDQ37426.1 cell division protein FtsA [Pseudodesulfovibrio nedwellii]